MYYNAKGYDKPRKGPGNNNPGFLTATNVLALAFFFAILGCARLYKDKAAVESKMVTMVSSLQAQSRDAQTKLRVKDRAHTDLEHLVASLKEEGNEHRRKVAALEHELRDAKSAVHVETERAHEAKEALEAANRLVGEVSTQQREHSKELEDLRTQLHVKAAAEADALVKLDGLRAAAAEEKHMSETCRAELQRYKDREGAHGADHPAHHRPAADAGRGGHDGTHDADRDDAAAAAAAADASTAAVIVPDHDDDHHRSHHRPQHDVRHDVDGGSAAEGHLRAESGQHAAGDHASAWAGIVSVDDHGPRSDHRAAGEDNDNDSRLDHRLRAQQHPHGEGEGDKVADADATEAGGGGGGGGGGGDGEGEEVPLPEGDAPAGGGEGEGEGTTSASAGVEREAGESPPDVVKAAAHHGGEHHGGEDM